MKIRSGKDGRDRKSEKMSGHLLKILRALKRTAVRVSS